jgi:hypothetical protein
MRAVASAPRFERECKTLEREDELADDSNVE